MIDIGSDICIEGVPNISGVGVESTLSRVREGHFSEALVVNTSRAPITLKHGLHLGQCLVHDKQVISEPEKKFLMPMFLLSGVKRKTL